MAELYDVSRQSYPDEIVATGGLGNGAAVLEIGCGTGQLTRQLVRRGLAVTAVDPAPSMIDVALRHLPDSGVLVHSRGTEVFRSGEAEDLGHGPPERST